MSLQIYIAHSGDRLSATPIHHGSLESFKAWLADTTGISPANQILLTSNGKQAKFAALCNEPEVFVYNRQLISSSATNKPALPHFEPQSVVTTASLPGAPASVSSLQQWRDLFTARQTWAEDVVRRASNVSKEFHSHFSALETIERGLGVAVGNLEAHVRALEQRYHEARSWSEDAIQDQDHLVDAAQHTLKQLRTLPLHTAFRDFFPAFDAMDVPPVQRMETSQTNLESFAPDNAIRKAITDVESIRSTMLNKMHKLGENVDTVVADAGELVAEIERHFTDSLANLSKDATQLMEEIEIAARKIASDAEHIKSLPSSERSVAQASKTASAHARERLPALQEYFNEMVSMLDHVVNQRNLSSARSIETMHRIAAIEANFASVNGKVVDLDVPSDGADALDYVSLVSQLPFMYGALLIEAVRRREWSDKIKEESTVLAEDIATYREEEDKRRKKWAKNMGHFVREDLASGTSVNFEVNVKRETDEWPQVSRDDISQYFHALRSLDGVEDVVEELSEAAKDLDKPTRAQVKKGRAFKMGSLQDASGAKGSMLLRDSDEVKALRESNSKLEEEIRGQRSRVRKLEDLLYKQGQSARSNTGNIFQSPSSDGQQVASPRSEEPLSRKASTNFRRTSQNWSGDEKNLARRIVTLEAELLDERQKRQELEKTRQDRTDDSNRIKTQIEEAHSTKRDLMENMEALQREFTDERRLLDEEIRTLKQRLEETEDDYDRLLGSRDNEKVVIDERQRAAYTELEQLKQDLASFKEEQSDREQDQLRVLQSIFANLSGDVEAPASFADLLNGIDEASERTSRRLKELAHNVSTAHADRDAARCSLEKQLWELSASRTAVQQLEKDLASTQTEAADHSAKAVSIASELEDARHQLRDLRAKFADGETGSEALRKRLEEQAAKAGDLSTRLAQEKSHVNRLDVELTSLQTKHTKLNASTEALTDRFEKRSTRDRELTTRLVGHYDALARLLESLGLSMTQRDGALAIQRTSKLANASSTLTDPGASTTFHQPFEMSPEPGLLTWMQAWSEEEEAAKFGALISKLDTFNMTTFAEAVIKLRRDVEWTGKKWKNEARNYRDKYHRAQAEAQEKIAYRSFKEGDLALFLPTRNQATRPWAAFNVGAPHFFLRERETHRLKAREWLVARISKVEERVVDLSKTMSDSLKGDGKSEGGISIEDDNPFELSDGLRWYMLDAAEEKIGAPSTPGLGKSTVASAHVDVKGSIERKKLPAGKDASAKLNKSLESRRSSSNSKRGSISGGITAKDLGIDNQAVIGVEGEAGPANLSGRPTSRSSSNQTGAGGTGLGLEIGPGGKPTSEERLKPESVGSPSKGFLGFLGSSPQRTIQPPARSPSRHNLSIQTQPPIQRSLSASSKHLKPPSPTRQQPHPLPQSESSASPSKARQGNWESLWSLDLNSDDKGKGRK